MKRHGIQRFAASLAVLFVATICDADVIIAVEHHDNNHATRQFKFDKVPPPSRDDAATNAKFTIIDGALRKGDNANDIDRLHDGKAPDWEDQPERNFAFANGDGGRIQVDLGRTIDIAQVNTYSWHPSTRGPQVYKLYAADGAAQSFDAKPRKGTDPATCGWTLIADIDTRPKQGDPGGQYGVSISDSTGSLGHDRYLLFDISRTEDADDWGNTFYSEIDVVERGVTPAPMAEYGSEPARRDPPGDPMDWKPPAQPPSIRPRYSDPVYAKMAKAVRDKIDVAALRAPGRPISGLLVREVKPTSQAIKLGIDVGDILMSLDGVPLGQRGESQNLNDMRNGQPQQLVFWSARAAVERTVMIQPGRIGVDTYEGPRLAESYARSSQRDPRWDDDMLVAADSYPTDPFLAETAFAHAIQSGYQGPLFTGLATRIAFNECRFDDALAFGWPNWSANQRLSTDTLRLYYTAALLGFKTEQALDLAARYPQQLTRDQSIAEMVAAYRAMPKSDAVNPVADLDNLHRTRVHQFGAFDPADSDGREASKWGANSLNKPEALWLDIPSGHYSKMILTPGFANVAFSAHYDVHNTDNIETPFAHCITFGLYDMTTSKIQWENRANWIKIVLMTDGPVLISPFGVPQQISLEMPRPSATPTRREGTIRMVILHNRCEVTLDDGKRIFYGPVLANESTRKFGFFMIAVGVTGRVLPPVLERLDDPRSPATNPASQPAGN